VRPSLLAKSSVVALGSAVLPLTCFPNLWPYA
jgi:hypothetical protein